MKNYTKWHESMRDMTGPSFATTDQLNESNLHHGVHYGALIALLIDKGVITQEEWDAALTQATACGDQIFAQKRDQQGE